MNKKYQVFVSSTYEDLKEERKAISQALLECGCIPAGMELFPASNKRSWDIIKKVIDESDYYLLIIAGKYGSTKKTTLGKFVGYTEMEYNYAKKSKKPIIAFIHNDVDNIVSKKVESTEEGKKMLDNFRNKVKNSRMQVSFWKDTATLISAVKTAIQELVKNSPSAGWVRVSDLEPELLDNEYKQKLEVTKNWGLQKIFRTRAEKNSESDPKLEKHNVSQLDGIAFGLSNFRSNREKDVLENLRNGMKMRLLVMDPNSNFVMQREIEENDNPGHISASIKKLVQWVNDLNAKSKNGKIEIKYYNSMTLDFYWRMDDELYVGPYLFNVVSQQTLTYKFIKCGRGFNMYTDYFESLWNNEKLCYYPDDLLLETLSTLQ